jgi:hypothetical protein
MAKIDEAGQALEHTIPNLTVILRRGGRLPRRSNRRHCKIDIGVVPAIMQAKIPVAEMRRGEVRSRVALSAEMAHKESYSRRDRPPREENGAVWGLIGG